MSKVRSVIAILQLLGRRPFVTLGEMVAQCGVSERTAYRYIRTLQSAGMPITFDRTHKAYRLDRPEQAPTGMLRLDHAVLTSLALRMLGATLNDSQREILDEVWQQTFYAQSSLITDVADIIRHIATEVSGSSDLAYAANALVIQAAAVHAMPITIQYRDRADRSTSVAVRQPSLSFREGWLVREVEDINTRGYRIEDIISVRVS